MRLIFPFEVNSLYLSQSQSFTEPSADFSKVSYFDKKKEQVINPSMPYISENLVSQPFNNQNMTLEKGLYLHFILPDALRSDKVTANGSHDLPPIPNRWLIIKNGTEKFIVESDYLFPEYTDRSDKVSIPIPWKVLKDKSLNVPFRYMGRQYSLSEPPTETGEYWHQLLPEPLSAEGYGEPSFVGFMPNCKDILTFYDKNPKENDEYEIWGWYELGDSKTNLSTFFKPIKETAKVQFQQFEARKNFFDKAVDYVKGTAGDLSTLSFSTDEKNNIADYLELDSETKNSLLNAPTAATIEAILQQLIIKDGIEIKLFAQKAIQDAKASQSNVASFLQNYSEQEKQQLASLQIAINKPLSQKLQTNAPLTNEDKQAIIQALLQADNAQTYTFKKTLADFEKEILVKEWELEIDGEYHPSDEDNVFLYCKTKIASLDDINAQKANINYEIAVGNSGTEAISAFVAEKLSANNEFSNLPKPHIENVLEALEFESLNGDSVDISSKFLAARHEKTFRVLEGGITYTFDFQIAPSTDATEENQAFRKLIKEQFTDQVNDLRQQIHSINLLQAKYDKNIRIIQSKRHQLFADWYKYMICAHPPYMQEQDYPKADDVMRYIYGHEVEDVFDLIIQTGFLEVPAGTSIPSLLGSEKNFPNALAKQIVDKFKVFRNKKDQLNQDIAKAITKKITALATASQNYKTASEALKAISYDAQTATPEQKNAYISAVALNNQYRNEVEELTIFYHLNEKTATYEVSTENGQRYFEANEPILLLAQKGAQTNIFDKKMKVHSFLDAPSNPLLDNVKFPNAPTNYQTQTASYANTWLMLEWAVNYRPIDDPSIEGKGYNENFIYENFDIRPDTPDFIPINHPLGAQNQGILLSPLTRRYTGSTYVTSGTNDILAQKLHKADISKYDTLFKAATKILSDYQCFTQSLGGFNEALLMRKQTMQLEVADPIAFEDYVPLIDRIRDFVGASRKSAPEPKHFFNPIRGGALDIGRLRLINTFGQAVDIYNTATGFENSPITRAETIKLPQNINLPARFQYQKDKLIYLPPRYTQPARIDINWVGADWKPKQGSIESDYNPNPICGWIAPNFLENNIFIFDQGGAYLGSMGVVNNTVRLFPKPGDNAFYINEIKNEHLRNFVRYFTDDSLGNSTQTIDLTYIFTEFQKGIEDSLDYIEPQNYAQFPAISLLAGRPLALVRASFYTELMEDYAINQDWNIFKQDILKTKGEPRETYHFEKVEVPIRIGDYDLLNDGVIAFWYKDIGYVEVEKGKEIISTTRPNPYTINLEDALYMPLFQKKDVNTRQAIIGKKKLKEGRGSFLIDQSLQEAPQVITMLMDPRGEMTVSSGLMPVKRVTIPPEYYKDILDKIQLYFLASPLLTPFEQLQMPLLNYTNTKWNWVEVEKNVISGTTVNEIPASPTITKSKLEQLYLKELAPQMATFAWEALTNTAWLVKSTNNATGLPLYEVGDLGKEVTLDKSVQPYSEQIKAILQVLGGDDDGKKITRIGFENTFKRQVLNHENFWQHLLDGKWLEPLPDFESRANINFDIQTRQSLPKQFDETFINNLINAHFDGIGHVNTNPQFVQNAIREGWLKMV